MDGIFQTERADTMKPVLGMLNLLYRVQYIYCGLVDVISECVSWSKCVCPELKNNDHLPDIPSFCS